MYPDRYAEDATLVEAGYAEWSGAHWTLPRVVGHCAYLDDATNLCLIHDERPRACRDYDCRVFAAAGIDAGEAAGFLSWLGRILEHAPELGSPPVHPNGGLAVASPGRRRPRYGWLAAGACLAAVLT